MKTLPTVIAATAAAATILHYGSSTLGVAAAAAEPKGLKCNTVTTVRKTNFDGEFLPQRVLNETMVIKLLNDTQWVWVSVDGHDRRYVQARGQ